MAWDVTEFPGEPLRILVCAADTPEELDELRRRAEARGWTYYVNGTQPETGRPALWLTKKERPPAGSRS